MTQFDFASKLMTIWLPLCHIEKIVTIFSYKFRKIGMNNTQCVQRIRLRPVTPQGRLDDLTVNIFEIFQRDRSFGHFRSEPALFYESVPFLLKLPTTGVTKRTVTENSPPVTVSFRFLIAPVPVAFGLAAV